MLIAVVATLLYFGNIDFTQVAIGIAIGTVIGVLFAVKVEMTQMPQMVAIFNGLGGGASALVAAAEFLSTGTTATFTVSTIVISVFIGTLTLSGSFIAFGKLQGFISGQPIVFPGQQIVNGIFGVALLVAGIMTVLEPSDMNRFILTIVISAILGVSLTVPIGGADMPVIISLLNSYSGIAAAATGFVLMNNGLIIAGSLVGASGIILTNIMCKGMNRSLANVIFGVMD